MGQSAKRVPALQILGEDYSKPGNKIEHGDRDWTI